MDNAPAALLLPCLSTSFFHVFLYISFSFSLFCNTRGGIIQISGVQCFPAPIPVYISCKNSAAAEYQLPDPLGSRCCWAHCAYPAWLIPCDQAGQKSWMCGVSQTDIFVILICLVTVFRDHTLANISFCNSWKSQKWKPFQFLQPCLCGRLSHFRDFLGNLSGFRLFPQASRKSNFFFCSAGSQTTWKKPPEK